MPYYGVPLYVLSKWCCHNLSFRLISSLPLPIQQVRRVCRLRRPPHTIRFWRLTRLRWAAPTATSHLPRTPLWLRPASSTAFLHFLPTWPAAVSMATPRLPHPAPPLEGRRTKRQLLPPLPRVTTVITLPPPLSGTRRPITMNLVVAAAIIVIRILGVVVAEAAVIIAAVVITATATENRERAPWHWHWRQPAAVLVGVARRQRQLRPRRWDSILRRRRA